jgi:hypothetical protein
VNEGDWEEIMTEAEALEKILKELQQLRADLTPTKQPLGFGAAPRSEIWIFCNREKGGLWYTLDSQGQAVNIEHSALTGYIRKLEFTKPVRRGEETHKLNCTIEGDKLYVLESGASVQFSKGLLNAIASLSSDALKHPITIVPESSGKNEEVLFCNVFQGDKQIFAPYDDQTNWRKVSRTAIDAVKAANSEALVELLPAKAG